MDAVSANTHLDRPGSRAEGLAAEVCIIGAGISGLTAAKALKEAGVGFEAFELGSDIGGMWRYENDSGTSSAYRSLHIDSSRQSLSYPDFPIPDHLPDYLSHSQVLDHFDRYADRFGLRDAIRFRTRVTRIEPEAGGTWRVRIAPADGSGPEDVRRYGHVIVANGHLSEPRYPDFPGTFSGEQIHSHHYRVATPFEGKSVLVVGIGNSAVDIAVDVARRADRTFLSTRRSAWIMPKYIGGIATDRWLRTLVARFRLPVPAARAVLHRIARLAIGDQERFGVPRPEHPIWREHATLSQDLLSYIGHGWIRMKPNVRAIDGGEVEFVDGTRERIDSIVYATGYRTVFPFLDPELFEVEDGTPPPLYRRIVSVEHPTLFFSGLVQPIGPTIPLVEIQGRWIASILSGRSALPDRARMAKEVESHRSSVAKRYVHASRYTLEVDFKEYAAALRKDMAE